MTQTVNQADEGHGDKLGFERLINFSDAIFSVAITLMALEIRLPDLDPAQAANQINAAIVALVPHLFVYVLSFAVIGLYWMLHRRLFRAIKRYNITLIWLNLIFLMFIALVPAATNALGSYPNLAIVSGLYAVSLALVGLSEFVLWWYAIIRHYTIPFNAPHIRLFTALRILTSPFVFLLSLLLIPFGSSIVQLSWLLMIPIVYVLGLIFPRERIERDAFEDGQEKNDA